ncbi:hypothetical protein [Gallaecimonas xiamenensis]|uniref:Uncharacterized protein n=1 Tax=Gallaecimonas xiamenensis 3-C-1 TaxID=745411 RepID=K2JLL7_9GAMM|nr:hypothetical protein [Gallaecimonas xiamenensis]EKE76198.1 hypothetical protein B3C1_04800 [Gallaecimonas xiamenensis 3-C-1]
MGTTRDWCIEHDPGFEHLVYREPGRYVVCHVTQGYAYMGGGSVCQKAQPRVCVYADSLRVLAAQDQNLSLQERDRERICRRIQWFFEDKGLATEICP